MVSRALRRRRHSVDYPLTSKAPSLTRTFSLSRNVRHPRWTNGFGLVNPDLSPPYPQKDARPADENKLHPFWRPHTSEEDISSNGHTGHGPYVGGAKEKHGISAHVPKRSFSARMKRTFAIFPIRDEFLPAETAHGSDRRTIRRTPSGNLRVMRRRTSTDSYLRRESIRGGTPAAPDVIKRGGYGGGRGLGSRSSQEKMRSRATGRRWQGIHKLPRMLSERRREKRTRQLRQMISGPKDVRDGVREVIEPRSLRTQRRCD